MEQGAGGGAGERSRSNSRKPKAAKPAGARGPLERGNYEASSSLHTSPLSLASCTSLQRVG